MHTFFWYNYNNPCPYSMCETMPGFFLEPVTLKPHKAFSSMLKDFPEQKFPNDCRTEAVALTYPCESDQNRLRRRNAPPENAMSVLTSLLPPEMHCVQHE